ncbi:MAG: AEC family transporter [Lachnospiraceae bacterium]|nr:AEC family transporter [Lachnospiraceae bacterium]
MENFIYSLNATVPVFLVMVIGYCLKRRGMLTEGFCSAANKFNFQVTLPALLFKDISSADIRQVLDIRYMLYCAIVTSICFFTLWGLTKLLMKDKSMVGAFVQASFRGSAAVLGIAFIQNIYGTSGMAPLMIVSAVPLYNIYSVIVLTFEGGNDGQDGGAVRRAFVNICKNPIIIGILLGVIVSFSGITFPAIVNKTVNSLAAMATPLALIVIGASFEGRKALAKLKPTMLATMIKLVVQPSLFLPVAVWMGFRTEKLIAILVMLGAPTTASCYIMAKNMNNDEVLTSSVVVAATLLSAVTLTGWIYILKAFGYLA